jgi:pyruvate dehydrogenase E1 component
MATPGPHPAITADGLPSQLPDIDPDETGDWLESLDGLLEDK